MSDLNKKVKIMHRLNRLKLKAGIPIDDDRLGYIDPAAIKKAQAAINSQEGAYAGEVEEILVRLDSTWEDLKKEKNEKNVKRMVSELYNFANNVKDMADTFEYGLMGHFGESLREFCEKIDVSKDAHHVIVQAHIDVMWVAFKHNIKDEGGPQAGELKAMLTRAIEKHG